MKDYFTLRTLGIIFLLWTTISVVVITVFFGLPSRKEFDISLDPTSSPAISYHRYLSCVPRECPFPHFIANLFKIPEKLEYYTICLENRAVVIDSEQGNKRISEKDILPPDPRKITLYITDAHKIIEQIPVELLSKGCKRLDSIASYNYLIEHPEINISSTATPYVSKADIVMNDSKLYIKTDPTAWFLELLRMIFLAHILFST